MTQTKEEILEANYQEFYDATQPGHRYPLWVADEPYVHRAMDLYAEQLTRQKDERIREAVANYMASEGCSCCEGQNHREHAKKLAELLNVPMYEDESGYNFHQFKSKD
jgi:excinuclease UvrABC ATPase subunit